MLCEIFSFLHRFEIRTADIINPSRRHEIWSYVRNVSIVCQVDFTASAANNEQEVKAAFVSGYQRNNMVSWDSLYAHPDLPVKDRALVETIQSISVTKEKV